MKVIKVKLNFVFYRKTINTVSELAKSNIRIGGWINETKQFFEISDDVDVKKIADKFEIINNETEAIELVANGLIAYYESTFALLQSRVGRQLVNEKKTNETEKIPGKLDSNLHVMKECVIYMPVSLGMEKNSPLKPRVDLLVVLILQNQKKKESNFEFEFQLFELLKLVC